ncbi:ABC transporter ATP-binding protein [Paenibacillus sp. R14(2021)]|uniref:ABC transporter ATP-binding protein n=1 Tax=Paenibacillus sp. R14(2021) TaxID=2859228 RepID=UPI001C611CB9|nr:ATP-binding cassette domain-containing protein [Paenibacillus sp. R14(2021)]
MSRKVILSVKDLHQHFRVDRKTTVRAVNGVSFEIYEGETFSIVGESGSGKSTLGRALIRIYDYQQGEVTFLGEKISGPLKKDKEKFLRRNMQMIFQDPMASLNPRKTILDIVAFGLDVNGLSRTPEERKQRVIDVLESVGLSGSVINRYPHQFSGGQRQRIGISRALVMEPKFIIADEIISALDVSIQAQVINLMKKLQQQYKLTYMFIAHDLSMVRSISDRVAVMHLGHIVELGNVKDIYENPVHPYTRSLLSSIPTHDPIREKTRVRQRYNKHDINYADAVIHQVSDTHQVLASEKHWELWREKRYDGYLV